MKSRNWEGLLLRSERLRRGKGQKEICIGICVPSYLSKIERGQALPTPEILEELFKRLDINYESDQTFLKDSERKINEFFRRMLYGLSNNQIVEELLEIAERLLYSPLRISYLLLKGFTGDEEAYKLLAELSFGMDRQQEALYYLLAGKCAENSGKRLEQYQKADDLLRHSYTMLMLAYAYLENSDYTGVHNLESRLVTAALEEGNTYTIAEYYLVNGTAYGSLDLDERMVEYYGRAIRMFENTGWKHALDDAYYNMGSVYLSQKKYAQAREYLDQVQTERFMLLHKKALLAIRSGNPDEGRLYLNKMQSSLEDGESEMKRLLYEEACMELEEDFLKKPEFEELVDALIACLQKHTHFGYLYFFKDVIVQTYISQRKYKKALDFQYKISSGMIKK